MATRKKTKKAARKKPAKTAKKSPKKIVKKVVAKKVRAPQTRVSAKTAVRPAAKRPVVKPAVVKRTAKPGRPVRTRGKQDNIETVAFEPAGLGPRSGGQSGDLQGLTNRAGADSESVDELLEEGNAFEAEVVKGVEDVPDADEGEIVTHEVPEDDVPREYDDEERPGRS